MDEKAVRLQAMLEEALKPIIEKMDTLENEVKSLRKGQEELKVMIQEDK
ncbi:hypothetical protein [Paraliobacillus ryukyuensis]|nr:hypothetical protein [Paraliobacillus ryukyuensis]